MTSIRPTLAPAVGRVHRRPQHPFALRHMPWAITPMMIAPVLPGETMKQLLMQSRAVTKPIKNPLIGWWLEYYFFYVKLRDLDGRDDFSEMMLDYQKDMSAYNSAASAITYHYAASINWVQLCLNKVVEEYFRDEDEAVTAALIQTLPAASLKGPISDWTDSLTNQAPVLGDDFNVDLNANSTITVSEVDKALRTWEYLRMHNMAAMSFEDYLATFGIKPKPEEIHRPELIRYIREWQYPTNVIEPTTGVPSSAVSWAVAERADKDRFFREPGFIFGVSIARPKVYYGRQTGSVTGLLNNAFAWLPAVMSSDPWTSVREVAAGAGPIGGSASAYFVDIKDLFLYGEQFVNFALSETGAGLVALPTAGMEKKYPAAADVNGLFTGATDPARMVEQDGVVNLDILGTQVDTTPQGMRA